LPNFTRAVCRLAADGADLFANGKDVIVNVVAMGGLDGLGNPGKQPKKRAIRRLFEPAKPVCGALGANVADLVANNRFQFF
jgi:hypothetical protein